MVEKKIKRAKVKVYSSDELEEFTKVSKRDKSDLVIVSKYSEKKSLEKSNDSVKKKKDQDKPKKKITQEKQEIMDFSSHRSLQIFFFIIGAIGLLLGIWLSTFAEITWVIIDAIVSIWGFGLAGVFYFRKYRVKSDLKKAESMGKSKEEVKQFKFWDLTKEEKTSLMITGFTFIAVIIWLVVAYAFGQPDPIISWAIVGIVEVRVVIFLVDGIITQKNIDNIDNEKEFEQKSKEFIFGFYMIQHILFGVLVFFGVPLFLGVDIFDWTALDEFQSLNLSFNICILCLVVSAMCGIWQMKRDVTQQEIDYDKSGMVRYLIIITCAILVMFLYPVSSAMISGIVGGGLGDFNYFNSIYVVIVGSKYTQFSMVIIVISAFSIIIGKARGQSGSATMVIGALGMAGVPMLITIMAFIGQVPAPLEFYELFGEGFAELVFAISYTSVISLALALVGIFYEIVPMARGGYLDD